MPALIVTSVLALLVAAAVVGFKDKSYRSDQGTVPVILSFYPRTGGLLFYRSKTVAGDS